MQSSLTHMLPHTLWLFSENKPKGSCKSLTAQDHGLRLRRKSRQAFYRILHRPHPRQVRLRGRRNSYILPTNFFCSDASHHEQEKSFLTEHVIPQVLCYGPVCKGYTPLQSHPLQHRPEEGIINQHSPENALLAQEMFLLSPRRLLCSSLLRSMFSQIPTRARTIFSKL